MVKLKFFNILFFICCFQLVAADVANSTNSPVKVNSDKMYYFSDDKRILFEDNVTAVSDEYVVTSDKINVYFNGRNSVVKIIGKGNVNFKTDDILALSSDAELDQISKVIVMKGGVKIWHKENYMEGEYVKIHYETQEFFIDKGEQDKVTVIFRSDSDMVAQ